MSPHELAAQVPLGVFIVFMALQSLVISLGLAALVGWLAAGSAGTRLRVVARKRFSGQFRQELMSASVVLLFDAAVVVVATLTGVMPSAPVSLTVHVVTFLVMVVWFDVWFYATHRLMHTRWFWRFHEVHHRAGVPHALTAFSFSLSERFILILGTVGASSLAALWLPVSGLGVFVYVLANTLFNAMGHCNADFYPAFLGRPGWGFVSTTTYHTLHHERSEQNYGLFFTALDGLFKTRAEDWQGIFLEVKAGKPLR